MIGKPKEDSRPCCIICGGESTKLVAIRGGSKMYLCLSCNFVFADAIPFDPVELFTRAYRGTESNGRMDDYYLRVAFARDVRRSGIRPDLMLNTVHQQAIALLRKYATPGSTILNIGCGLGWFLDVVNKLGYKAAGLEVAEPLVELLRENGYPVWHGTIDTLPADWIDPQVCVSFFTLHHMTDPIRFLSTVRTKFPKATLIVAEYNFTDYIREKLTRKPSLINVRNLPPRTYCWWGERHLRRAMERAGYQVETIPLHSRPVDSGLNSIGIIYPKLRHYPFLLSIFIKLFPHYLTVWRWFGWPRTLILRHYILRGHGYVMAIGRPISYQV